MSEAGPSHGFVPGIKWRKRSILGPLDWLCMLIFWAGLIVQIAFGFAIVGNKNSAVPLLESYVSSDEGICPDGYFYPVNGDCGPMSSSQLDNYDYYYCLDSTLCDNLRSCLEASPSSSTRLLQDQETKNDAVANTLWDVFDKYPYIPAVIFASMVVAGVVWLQLMQSCTRIIVFGTLFIAFAFPIAMWIYLYTEHSVNNWMLLVGSGLILLFVMCGFRAINEACKVIALAAQGLKHTPSVFFASMVMKTFLVAYVALWTIFMIMTSTVKRIDEPSCEVKGEGWVTSTRWWMGLLFFPFVYWFTFGKTVITAAGIGAWYWGKGDVYYEDRPSSPAFKGLFWAFTTSSGAVMFASVVVGFTRWLFNKVEQSLGILPCQWLLSPITCLFACFKSCVMGCLEMFSKFMLIGQVFSGKAFCGSARRSFQLVSSRLGTAFLTDSVGHAAISICTYLLAGGLGIAAWVWIDDAQQYQTFEAMEWYVMVPVLLLYAFMISYPTVSVVLIAWLADPIHKWTCGDVCDTDDEKKAQRIVNSLMGALFVGSVCYLFFDFIGDILLSSIDVIFFCFAIEKDNNVYQSRFSGLYSTLKEYKDVKAPIDEQGRELEGGGRKKAGGEAPVAIVTTAAPTPTTGQGIAYV